MSDQDDKRLPSFLKTVYLSNREIRLILAGLYSLNMSKEEVEGTLWKKLLFEKLHKKTRRKLYLSLVIEHCIQLEMVQLEKPFMRTQIAKMMLM